MFLIELFAAANPRQRVGDAGAERSQGAHASLIKRGFRPGAVVD